jgi:hypothetical protein
MTNYLVEGQLKKKKPDKNRKENCGLLDATTMNSTF